MIDVTGLRSAPVEEFLVAGTRYRGANPQYVNVAKPGQPPHFMKAAKGVPWRKVKDD